MTPDHFRRALKRHNLSQQEAARFLDVNEHSVRRWASGSALVPFGVEALFALMAHGDYDPAAVLAIVDHQDAA